MYPMALSVKMIKQVKSVGAIVFLLFLQVFVCYALPWKSLHEKADKETLTAVLADAVKNPNAPEALYPLALVYLNMYKINEADGVFLDMLQLDPKSVEAKWGHAEILRRRHKLDQSRAILEEIVKKNPEFSPATITLGYLLYEKKDYEEAVHLMAKVLKQGAREVDLSNYVRAYLIMAGSKGMLATTGGIWHQPWQCEVTGQIKKGNNEIEVIVIGTLKNTLGLHHSRQSLGQVSPSAFREAPPVGPPAGNKYNTISYGLFEPFELVTQ